MMAAGRCGALTASLSRRGGAAPHRGGVRPAAVPRHARPSRQASQGGTSVRGGGDSQHFRLSAHKHPLGIETNPTLNRVWTRQELDRLLAVRKEQPHHVPTTPLDSVIYGAVRFCYHAFNYLTGYRREDPSPSAVSFRLLVLESVAGVPGMVAGMSRHFRSLKRMERDNGWIHTLLEEAENERMHLLVFLTVFRPSMATRALVRAAQYVLAPTMLCVYAVHPPALHRFVGYLEETAVITYTDVIHWIRTPGSQLHDAWAHIPAPTMAKEYWRLPEGSMFLDVVEQIAADETHHRDVNHTFASMGCREANPFVDPEHHVKKQPAWEGPEPRLELNELQVLGRQARAAARSA